MSNLQIRELISKMTLEEKASFFSGKDFWHLQGLERLGIPSVMVTDGPYGLRKQVLAVDHLGLSDSKVAICFPAGCALASSFQPKLAEKMGSEIGKLATAEDVSTVLGPAMNIKRSPLCGRNFEYLSEDPYVSSKMAAGTIKGIQKENVGASPKHFLANNQEYYRMTSSSDMDERTMREIYLTSFEEAVKEAKPWTMMCSYNRINGVFACENKKYLTNILRDEWGFEGYVMTDWGALDEPIESIKAGLDLAMPGPGTGNTLAIIEAVQKGTLDEQILDQSVERILNIVFRYKENHVRDTVYDFETGHEAAREIVEECIVLLKNEDDVLPLKDSAKVAFIGQFVKTPRYQGGGSSHIHAYKVSSVWDSVGNLPGVSYALGYDGSDNASLRAQAVETARNAESAVIFAGLPEDMESEGFDRIHLDMPEEQNQLIEAVAAVQPNTIVVLHNGAPITMPWITKVKGIVEAYLGGEAIGQAISNILFGKVNPSGRLAETFPLRLEDTPAYPYYGVEKDHVTYREGILVGYRHYETKKISVLFPFGYGLSYTTFTYSDLKISADEILDTDNLTVTINVTNTGKKPGKEVVQLYVSASSNGIVRPIRELKGFEKVSLEAGETKRVTFTLDKRAFAYWDMELHDWYAPTDEYRIQIGKSISDVVLEATVKVNSTMLRKTKFTLNSAMGDMMENPIAKGILQNVLGQMNGHAKKEEIEERGENEVMSEKAIEATTGAMPLRALLSFSPNIKREQVEQLIAGINQAIENA